MHVLAQNPTYKGHEDMNIYKLAFSALAEVSTGHDAGKEASPSARRSLLSSASPSF